MLFTLAYLSDFTLVPNFINPGAWIPSARGEVLDQVGSYLVFSDIISDTKCVVCSDTNQFSSISWVPTIQF